MPIPVARFHSWLILFHFCSPSTHMEKKSPELSQNEIKIQGIMCFDQHVSFVSVSLPGVSVVLWRRGRAGSGRCSFGCAKCRQVAVRHHLWLKKKKTNAALCFCFMHVLRIVCETLMHCVKKLKMFFFCFFYLCEHLLF